MVAASLETLSKDDLLSLVHALGKTYHIPTASLKALVKKTTGMHLPSYIFTKELSALESICKYLKEEGKLTYHAIAQLLNRNDRTIWTTYHNACKKMKESFVQQKIVFLVPLSLFKDRTITALGHIVKYLKESYAFTYRQIGLCLQRNERTIWTIYQRIKKSKHGN